jgi:lipopolysaccharide assembly outer membrane protein LptD (OstA)
VAGEDSGGESVFAYGHDEEIDSDSLDEPFDRDRWLTAGIHEWFLPLGTRFQTDFAFASDNDVPLDFQQFSSKRADRFLESVASLSRPFGATGRFGGIGSAFFAEDFQSPDDLDRDDSILQRLPQLSMVALAGSVPHVPLLRPSLDAEYIRFEQDDRPYGGAQGFVDTGVDGVRNADERVTGPGLAGDRHADNAAIFPGGTEGDGVFQEGELLTDAGNRVILQPRMAAPFRLGRFAEVYPEVGWHQTFYDTRQQSSEQRGLLTGRVDLRSRLRRSFSGDVAHLVEPFAGWAYVSPDSQSGNPLLLPATALPQDRIRSLDLDAVTRDSADRIGRANRLSFGVTQRLFGDGSEGRWIEADATLQGLYDFESDDWENVWVDGRLTPRGVGTLRFNLGVDTDQGRVDEGLGEWRWRHNDGHTVAVTYRFLRNIPDVFEDFGTGRFDDDHDERRVEQVAGDFRLALTRQVSLAYRMSYSFATDRLLGNTGVVEYFSKCECWALGVEVSEDRARGFEVKLLYRLIGLGNDQRPNPGGLLDW